MDIQIKLSALPIKSRAWVAHCQIGQHGNKEQGAYVSHEFVVSDETARIILGGERTFSFRKGSPEIYYKACSWEKTWLLFGGSSTKIAVKEIIEAVTNQTPLFEELEDNAKKELEVARELWLKTQQDISALENDPNPKVFH
tara:strand:+ start:13780 stop:14202 length:423 start_codon:yes stop_codon:yes gene_type:complete